MNTIKQILVPVDLSDTSLHSVLYALEFAKDHNCKVEVFYNTKVPLVYGEGAYYGNGLGTDNAIMMAQAYQMEDEAAMEQLGNFKTIIEQHRKERHLTHVIVNYNFQFGSAITDINNEVQTNHIDLIISGIHDKHHPSNLVKGISEKLLRNAKIPVIAVPEQNDYKSIKNVAYTFDYHKHTIEDIEQFLAFIKPFGTKTHCVHVGKMLNKQHHIDSNIKTHFKDHDLVDFHQITSSSLNEGIHEFTNKHNIDAIAMHPHKTTIWNQLFGENRLESILEHTNLPIISAH